MFISNNQTLNICFLANRTCEDYFRAPPIAVAATERPETAIMDEPQLIEKTKRVKSSGEDSFYSYDYEELLLADSAEPNPYNIKKNNTSSNFSNF